MLGLHPSLRLVSCFIALLLFSPTLYAAASHADSSLPAGVISIQLPRIKNLTAYGVEFEVGTPPQSSTLLADTGSWTIGFQNPRNNECQQDNHPCELYGSYDNTTSSTAMYAGPGYSNVVSSFGTGDYSNDTLRFGGEMIGSVKFGVYDQVGAHFYLTAPDTGILGLGASCLTPRCDSYPSLIQQLYDRNFLFTRAFSVYLGPDDPSSIGTLLLGGIDRAKQDGPSKSLPMLNVTSNAANHQANWLNYSSVSFTSSTGNTTIFDTPNGSFTLLDTGTPEFYLPSDAWLTVSDYFGIPANISLAELPFSVDCQFRQSGGKDTINIGFTDDFTIRVPMSRLVTQRDDGTCVTYAANGGGIVLGTPFLRSVYAVFNVDNLSITLSQVRYTDSEDIVAITS